MRRLPNDGSGSSSHVRLRASVILEHAFFAVALLATTVASACQLDPNPVTTDPPVVDVTSGRGTLSIDWSIDGFDDPDQCARVDAAAVRLVTTPAGSTDTQSFDETCTSRRASVQLAPAHYSATAVLIDGSGNARSQLVTLEDFAILGNDEIETHIDFVPLPLP